MPNYTKNELKVYGSADLLKYFYEKNRVTEEDVKFMPDVYGPYVYDLSFEKSVSRHNYQITTGYIQKIICKAINAGLSEGSQTATSGLRSPPLTAQSSLHPPPPREIKYDGWDYYVYLWGTKSEAIDPTAYLEYIDGKEDHLGIRTQGYITYTFDTAWSYPETWLKAVANLYPKLKFVHLCMNEDDGYEMEHTIIYEDGKLVSEKSSNRAQELIEERGGMEQVMKDLIKLMESEPIKIDYQEVIEEAIRQKREEDDMSERLDEGEDDDDEDDDMSERLEEDDEDDEEYYSEIVEKAFYDVLPGIDSLKGTAFDMLVDEYFGFSGMKVVTDGTFAKKWVKYIQSQYPK